jgi:hypothetical protein
MVPNHLIPNPVTVNRLNGFNDEIKLAYLSEYNAENQNNQRKPFQKIQLFIE